MRNLSGKKKALILLFAVFLIIGLVATIYLVQTRQETRSRAEKATVLSFAPATQDVQPGAKVDLDVNINPGTNQVNYVQLVINFDFEKFDSTATTFTIDPNSSLTFLEQPITTEGQIAMVLFVGSNPTEVIQSTEKIGTLHLKVKENTSNTQLGGETQVTFDNALTEIRSIDSADAYNENVLSSTIPATVNILAVCWPDIATCTWDPVDGAVTYNYTITDIDNNEIILEGNTSDTSVQFTITPGGSYSCSVSATNDCGATGEAGEGIDTCTQLTPKPTATPSASPTPSLTPTATPSGSVSPTPTLTVTPTNSPTLTPTVTPTNSPTPTPTTYYESESLTPTDIIYEEDYVEETPTPTYPEASTPTPTIADTGSPVVVIGGIVGGVLVLLGGLLLLAL